MRILFILIFFLPLLAWASQPDLLLVENPTILEKFKIQKKVFLQRNCPHSPEFHTVQEGRVHDNGDIRYIFYHIICNFPGGNASFSRALLLIHNGKSMLRGREFFDTFSGEGSYKAETGKLTYSAPFVTDEDPRCCPTGVGEVIVDVSKMTMYFQPIKPIGNRKEIPSRVLRGGSIFWNSVLGTIFDRSHLFVKTAFLRPVTK